MAYKGRVPGGADLVCYWMEKAGQSVADGEIVRAGLVATNSIRSGKNRAVLDRITRRARIFDAWEDEPWVLDGAAVRVSLVACSRKDDQQIPGHRLNGKPVGIIHADLTGGDEATADMTNVRRLNANMGITFHGICRNGAFDVPGDQARAWLQLPRNPNGRANSDVLKPWANGMDLTRRPTGKWIIDFGPSRTEEEAALYEAPYEHVAKHVRPKRQGNRVPQLEKFWWRHQRPRPEMREALEGRNRYIATSAVSKHRVFLWYDIQVCPDHKLIVFTRDDDVTFGLLHNRFHELWSLRLGSWHGVGNDPVYTPSTTFETFPFPPGLTPDIPASEYAYDPRAIAVAREARRLVELRDRWLNPSEWVEWADEPVPGYPKRPVPRDEDAAKALKKRTLANLYNARPKWLVDAHEALDAAVAAAYGWPADISDDDVLRELLALNGGGQ